MISLCFQETDALVSGTEPLLASEQNQPEHSLLYLCCLLPRLPLISMQIFKKNKKNTTLPSLETSFPPAGLPLSTKFGS